jgi:hypothetical protein
VQPAGRFRRIVELPPDPVQKRFLLPEPPIGKRHVEDGEQNLLTLLGRALLDQLLQLSHLGSPPVVSCAMRTREGDEENAQGSRDFGLIHVVSRPADRDSPAQ